MVSVIKVIDTLSSPRAIFDNASIISPLSCVWVMPIRILYMFVFAFLILSFIFSQSARILLAYKSAISPSSDNTISPFFLKKTGVPSSSSSFLMWCDTAGCVSERISPALVKFLVSHTVMNVSSLSSSNDTISSYYYDDLCFHKLS